MRYSRHAWITFAILGLSILPARAQQGKSAAAPQSGQTPPPALIAPSTPPPSAPSMPPPPPPPPANAVAATANGQPILEMAVYRALRRIPPDKHAVARPDTINFLVDNSLIDQHLTQLRIPVDAKEVDTKLTELKAEILKHNSTFDQVMKQFLLTEAELRSQIESQLRWDRFLSDQATEKVLREMFDHNKDMFDGSMVQARHILLVPSAQDARATDEARNKLMGYKKQIEAAGAQEAAKAPVDTDNLSREKARAKGVEDAFSSIASKESACPSKAQGGDLGFFPRAGFMVEPFAQTAFALKPHQMSDVVTTQFGCHLILVTARNPGKEMKFEDAKDEVKDAFGERMRESLLAKLRPAAKIAVNPPPKM